MLLFVTLQHKIKQTLNTLERTDIFKSDYHFNLLN